ncbi:MAG TPA: hypothetical protein VIV11_00025 [Kofleriaceae bacterium]
MGKADKEFLDELRQKSVEAAAEIMESLQRLKLLYEEITDDGSGCSPPKSRPADFFFRLARFELEHAQNIIRLGNSQAELIFDHVREIARRAKGGAVPTAVVSLEPVTVKGDHFYIGTFEIKSSFEKDADVRFDAPHMRDAQGEDVGFSPSFECSPNPVIAHHAARVTVTVPAERVKTTLFGEVTVYLLGDCERQVARRAIKVRHVHEAPPPPHKAREAKAK